MILGDFLNNLAVKAGIKIDDADLKSLLSTPDLQKIQVPDNIASTIDSSLLSVDQAKNNHPAIAPHYKAQALNAVDVRLETIMNSAGLSQEVITELKGIKNTYERIDAITNKVIEATNAKAGAKGGEDKSAIQKQLEETLEKLRDAEKDANSKVAAIEQQRKQDLINFQLQGLYSGKKTIYDELAANVKTMSLSNIINNSLQEKGAEFVIGADGVLTLQKKDGTTFIGANHSPVTPQQFIDDAFAQNKVIILNDKSNPGVPPKTVIANEGQPGSNGNNQVVKNLNKANRAAFMEGSPTKK